MTTEAYVRSAPEMLDFVEATTSLSFNVLPQYFDDAPTLPGGQAGGRSFLAKLESAVELDGFEGMLSSLPEEFEGIGYDPASGSKTGGRGGAILVAGLLDALLRAGVRPELRTRAVELITEHDAVVGVRIESSTGMQGSEMSAGGGPRHRRLRVGRVARDGLRTRSCPRRHVSPRRHG